MRPSKKSTVSYSVCDTRFSTKYGLVVQELMQTDLHRVIRTQHLSDDHCQVSLTVRAKLKRLNVVASISFIKH